MPKHQKRSSDSLPSARFVAPTKGRLLLATASALALQAVITAGPAFAEACVISTTASTNATAVSTTTFETVDGHAGVPVGATNLPSVVTGVTDNYDGATAEFGGHRLRAKRNRQRRGSERLR